MARSFYCFPSAASPTLSALAIRAKRIPNLQNRKLANLWEKNADVETGEVEKVKIPDTGTGEPTLNHRNKRQDEQNHTGVSVRSSDTAWESSTSKHERMPGVYGLSLISPTKVL